MMWQGSLAMIALFSIGGEDLKKEDGFPRVIPSFNAAFSKAQHCKTIADCRKYIRYFETAHAGMVRLAEALSRKTRLVKQEAEEWEGLAKEAQSRANAAEMASSGFSWSSVGWGAGGFAAGVVVGIVVGLALGVGS